MIIMIKQKGFFFCAATDVIYQADCENNGRKSGMHDIIEHRNVRTYYVKYRNFR